MKLFVWDFNGTLTKGSENIAANDYAQEVLSAIALKHQQIVISSISAGALKALLEAAGLERFFPGEKRFGAGSLFQTLSKAKQKILDQYLQASKENYDKIIIIGDSAKDIPFAPNSVSYLYAYPGEQFREAKADHRIQDLREVLKEI